MRNHWRAVLYPGAIASARTTLQLENTEVDLVGVYQGLDDYFARVRGDCNHSTDCECSPVLRRLNLIFKIADAMATGAFAAQSQTLEGDEVFRRIDKDLAVRLTHKW